MLIALNYSVLTYNAIIIIIMLYYSFLKILFRIDSIPFSMSIQPLTAFGIVSYRKQDFAEAEGRKTEIGERCMHRQRGRGRGKKFHTGPERHNLAKATENQRRFA